jgi:DNA-binding beta-propeller fold protein YncE
VAVGPDGSVYVTDTWNHRVQKFTADGRFLQTWGTFGQGETPEAFWGPRGIAVDDRGHVYVADTGNKRIVVFDENGVYVTQFGTEGTEPGQFNEPVAVALDDRGRVYVTDTWNQRVQVFDNQERGEDFYAIDEWGVEGWFGQSLENKPFIAVTLDRNILVTDPEMGRVLEFNDQGEIMHAWDLNPSAPGGFSLVSGLALDSAGGLWVGDAQNQRLIHFSLLGK